MAPPLNKEQTDLLHDLYFNKKMFLGRDKLFQYLQANNADMKISRRQVMDWLRDQEVHQLYKQKKKTKNIQTTILKEPWKQIGIDLADMQTMESNGYKYILVAVDLFSKYVMAKALKNKETKTVTEAMESLIKSVNGKIGSIRSDNGSEFISDEFKKMLKKHNIKQVLSSAGAPQSNGNVERINGVLKRMIKMTITQTDNHDWNEYLHQLVDNLNRTKSRVTKKVPYDVINSNTKETNEEINNNIKKSTKKQNESIKPILFKKGDKVRLKLEADNNQKENEYWTRDVFTIYKVIKPRKEYAKPYYLVEYDGEKYTEKLYNEDLQKIDKVENPIQEPNKFVISKIVSKKKVKGKVFYEVKWKNQKETTWEPESNLMMDIPKMVNKFNNASKK